MGYRIDKQGLLDRMGAWNGFLGRKVHLIACGGTALTLLGLKPSTKDIDLMVPRLADHRYLTGILPQLGYKQVSGWGWDKGDGFIFDLFRGNSVHTTELLESPLERNNHILFKEFSRIYLGILNYYDLIISKLFRATALDLEDCILLIRNKRQEIDFARLAARFKETAAFDVSQAQLLKNFEHFISILRKERLLNEK